MTDNTEKKFSICQEFCKLIEKAASHQAMIGDVVKHFGVNWQMRLSKTSDGLVPSLCCYGSGTDDWSINTTYDVIVNEKPFKTGIQFEFKEDHDRAEPMCITKEDPGIYHGKTRTVSNFLIEFHVKINSMTGIPEKQKSIKFDDDVAKEASDVVMTVGDQKFYVNKMYLSFHSTYFKALFSVNFSESQKSEIELKDIDSNEFQSFLEVLYVVSTVEDDTVWEILKLADFFDAKAVLQRCEEFLMNSSKGSLKFKFQLAIKYKSAELKKQVFDKMFRSSFLYSIPENSADFDAEFWKELSLQYISFLDSARTR